MRRYGAIVRGWSTASGEVVVEVFGGEVELLPGRLSVDVELN